MSRAVALVSMILAPMASQAAEHPATTCAPDPHDPVTVLVLETTAGSISIELDRAAAPVTIERLKKLIAGPIGEPHDPASGFYDGLSFDHTHPHVEIITQSREPAEAFGLRSELDARTLGLDRHVVSDSAEAMSIVQWELLVAHRKSKKSGGVSEHLRAMLDQWYENYSPDFLIGVSRKEINEALGYEYQSGLESRPAVRGSVLLVPLSPTQSSARLSILLADIPERTGRWMVIGRVVDGMDVVESISIQPRIRNRRFEFRPVNPVVIDRARLDSAPPCESGPAPRQESQHATVLH